MSNQDANARLYCAQTEKTKSNTYVTLCILDKMYDSIGKQAYNFSFDDIEAYFYSLDSHSAISINNQKITAAAYTDWAIENKLSHDGINHWKEIASYVKYVSETDSPWYKESEIANMIALCPLRYKFAVWGLYHGLKVEDVPVVKLSDLNEELKILSYNGKEYPVSDLFIQVAKETNDCIQVIIEQRRGDVEVSRKTNAIHFNNSIWYSIKGKPKPAMSVYNVLTRNNNEKSLPLSAPKIQLSGFMNCLMKLEGYNPEELTLKQQAEIMKSGRDHLDKLKELLDRYDFNYESMYKIVRIATEK